MAKFEMDTEFIRKLAKLLEETNLGEIEMAEGDRRIRVARPKIVAAAMAPALIIGLRGRPVPGSRLMALNASPVGSTPTFFNTSARVLSSSARP